MTDVGPLEAGRAALGAGRWADARAAFEDALRLDGGPDAFLGLGEALWWLGENRRSVECLERAYAAFRRQGDATSAVMTAITLSFTYTADFDNRPVASGWVARAERILEGMEPGPLLGWVLLARSEVEFNQPVRSAELATRALDLGRSYEDRDLELCALSSLGQVLVAMGRVREGLALLDEALAGTFGGECQRLDTVVFTSCSMMGACETVADIERATQWCKAADTFTRTYGCPYLHARCRVGYGTVLAATGRWADAERELTTAVQMSLNGSPAMYGLALARLAVLRVRQGRLEEAEALLGEVTDELAATLPSAMAELHCGRPGVAVALLQRRIGLLDAENTVDLAQTLELLVEAHLAGGNVEAAASAAEHLVALAAQEAHDLMAARADHAWGEVAAARGDIDAAVGHLEAAMDRFFRLQLPWDAAHARLELVRVLREAQPDVAVAEARKALASFDHLGAVPGADAAAALLRSLGVAGRTGPKDPSVLLSRREQEALQLVGVGLSNPEIAERLFISRKTASHHVSSVLGKLGFRNRAEAIAYIAAQRVVASK